MWIHRLQNSLIKKALRVSQREVLLGMTGAYRTASFAAVTVVAGHPPLDLEIKETHSRWEIKRQMRQETAAEAQNYLPCTKCFGVFFLKKYL